jgi:hypothetical protein
MMTMCPGRSGEVLPALDPVAGVGKQLAELQHAAPPDLLGVHRRGCAGDHLVDRLKLLVQPQLQGLGAERGQAAFHLVAVEAEQVQGVEDDRPG